MTEARESPYDHGYASENPPGWFYVLVAYLFVALAVGQVAEWMQRIRESWRAGVAEYHRVLGR